MKKILSLFALFTLILIISCSVDNAPADLSNEVTGTYEGYTTASCAYFSNDMSANQKVILTGGSQINTVNISFTSTSWGSISITDVTIGVNEQGYTISGSGKWTMGMNGNTKDYECTVTAVIKSSESQFTFFSPSVMGGLKIIFTTGAMPSDSGNE